MSGLTLATVTAADFEAVLGQPCRLIAEGMDYPAVVWKLRPLRKATRWQQRDTFAIEFRMTTDRLIPQGVFEVHLPDWPPLDVFCVPVQPIDGGYVYEAVFA